MYVNCLLLLNIVFFWQNTYYIEAIASTLGVSMKYTGFTCVKAIICISGSVVRSPFSLNGG